MENVEKTLQENFIMAKSIDVYCIHRTHHIHTHIDAVSEQNTNTGMNELKIPPLFGTISSIKLVKSSHWHSFGTQYQHNFIIYNKGHERLTNSNKWRKYIMEINLDHQEIGYHCYHIINKKRLLLKIIHLV